MKNLSFLLSVYLILSAFLIIMITFAIPGKRTYVGLQNKVSSIVNENSIDKTKDFQKKQLLDKRLPDLPQHPGQKVVSTRDTSIKSKNAQGTEPRYKKPGLYKIHEEIDDENDDDEDDDEDE